MTKQQTIKELVKRGWTFVRNDGKFSVVLLYPASSKYAGQEGIFDPRDLLESLLESELQHTTNRSDLQRRNGESQNDYLARLIFGEGVL